MFDSFQRISDLDARKKLECNACERSTIQTLEAQCLGRWSYEHPIGGHINGGSDFSLFRCGACDAVCFEKMIFDSEMYDHDENGNILQVYDTTQYPPPSAASLTFNTLYTPLKLHELLDEMMYALAGGKLKLATVGLRMTIEWIADDAKCSGRNLHAKIDDLKTKSMIDEDQRSLLQKIRKKGNDGAHKSIGLSRSEMIAGLGVVEMLITELYHKPARNKDIVEKANAAFK